MRTSVTRAIVFGSLFLFVACLGASATAETYQDGRELPKTAIAQVHTGMAQSAVRAVLGDPQPPEYPTVWSYRFTRVESSVGILTSRVTSRQQTVTVQFSADGTVQSCFATETSSDTGTKFGAGAIGSAILPVSPMLQPQIPCDRVLQTTRKE